jgi:UDP-4-keto-D-QuiNAc 4-reductase
LARIVVTGAAGFIGSALCRALTERGHDVLGLTRRIAEATAGVRLGVIGDIGPQTDWSGLLDRADAIIHLANRAHHPAHAGANAAEPAAAAKLASAAAKAGVRRLIHMSSIRAMGDMTMPGRPFLCTDAPSPRDAYGRGKLAVERALRAAARQDGIELVILRPPLVYGPGVKANFRSLIRLAGSGLPLPFAGIDNRRSLIFLDNLIDLVARVAIHPGIGGRVLLARDGVDWSTPELIRALAGGLGAEVRLFSVPERAFAPVRLLPILGPMAASLTLWLQVDDRETRALLDWVPPVPREIGLAATARATIGRR